MCRAGQMATAHVRYKDICNGKLFNNLSHIQLPTIKYTESISIGAANTLSTAYFSQFKYVPDPYGKASHLCHSLVLLL